MIIRQYFPDRMLTRYELSCDALGCDRRYGFELREEANVTWHAETYLESKGWFEVLTPTGTEYECDLHADRGYARQRQERAARMLDADRRWRDREFEATARQRAEIFNQRASLFNLDKPSPPKQVVKPSPPPVVAQGWARGYNWLWRSYESLGPRSRHRLAIGGDSHAARPGLRCLVQ